MFRKIFCTMLSCLFTLTMLAEEVCVIGVGRLGLPFALLLENAGHHVIGVDNRKEYVEELNQKTFCSSEPEVSAYLQKSKNFSATTSIAKAIKKANICFIAVPTNSVATVESYDHSIVSRVLQEINACKVTDKTIVITSTVFPEYTRQIAMPLIKDCKNVTLSYNPEFVAQGSIIHDYQNPDLILIGSNHRESADLIAKLNQSIAKSQPYIAKLAIESAEIAKLSLNCFITAKIAFANFVGDIAEMTPGADKFELLNAIGHDSRIGNKYFRPGYGFGGPCFPRDNRALANYARTKELNPIIFETTDAANDAHAEFMATMLLEQGLEVYTFEKLNYKNSGTIPIIQESQKLKVAKLLAERGKKIILKDTEEILALIKAEYGDLFIYSEAL